MSRRLQTAALAVVAILAALMIAAWAVHVGIVPDDTVRLWARANTAGTGSVAIGRIVAAYPAVPFLTTTLVALVTPDGTPAPALVAAGLLGLLSAVWFSALRTVGLPPLAAIAATLLLALHPALLQAVVGGPADMFLALFIFLVGRGFYDLRAHGNHAGHGRRHLSAWPCLLSPDRRRARDRGDAVSRAGSAPGAGGPFAV